MQPFRSARNPNTILMALAFRLAVRAGGKMEHYPRSKHPWDKHFFHMLTGLQPTAIDTV